MLNHLLLCCPQAIFELAQGEKDLVEDLTLAKKVNKN